MNIITQHMIDDDNAVKHADLGLASFALACLGFMFGLLPWYAMPLSPFAMGALIELKQRVWRSFIIVGGFKWLGFTGKHQNSMQESLLDVMQTGLFSVTYYVNRKKKHE